jgi:hypothetical protein
MSGSDLGIPRNGTAAIFDFPVPSRDNNIFPGQEEFGK